LQDRIVDLIPAAIPVTVTGAGGVSCLLILLFRRKKKFHGIYTADFVPEGMAKGDEELWFVPVMTENLRSGAITAEEYIERLLSCGQVTKFPADTKMTISVGDDVYTVPASEKELFKILRETTLPLSVTFSSEKTGMMFTLNYR